MRILVPATLHQCPQLGCEGWMCWPLRAAPVYYIIDGCCGLFLAEGNRTGERLDWLHHRKSKAETRGSFTAHLYHDHSEGENIRLLAIRPVLQDFWRRPS